MSSTIRSLRLSIDHALAVSYRQNDNGKKPAFVAHITLVKGIPFYGYHVGYRLFFKIYLLNPLYITRLADLLLQGAVMGRPFQPYESHMQYIPQWMCDYNLYGCAYIRCSKVKFRSPVPDYLELTDLSHRWHDRSIQPECVSDETVLPKQSHCLLEADICAQDILNRTEIKERPIHHDFTEMFRPVAPNERLVPSMAALWQDETRRRKKRLGIDEPGSSPFGPEELISMSADPRSKNDVGWIHEEEFREMVLESAAEEKRHSGDKKINFENFFKKNPFEDNVKTALESIEDFFPDKIQQSSFESYQACNAGERGDAEISVDESTVLSSQHDGDHYSSVGEFTDKLDDNTDEAADPFNDELDGLFDIGFENTKEQQGLNKKAFLQVDTKNPSEDHFGESSESESELKRGITNGEPRNAMLKRRSLKTDGDISRKRQRTPREQHLHSSRTFPIPDCRQLAHSNTQDVNGITGRAPGTQDRKLTPRPKQSSQNTNRPKGSTQDSKLNFPVVKNANNPSPALPFSQEGNLTPKATADTLVTQESPILPKTITKSSQEARTGTASQLKSFSTDTSSDIYSSPIYELASRISQSFNILPDRRICCFRAPCPKPDEISSTLNDHGYPSVIYPKAHYSDEKDVPDRPREYAGRGFRLEGSSIHYLPDLDPSGRSPAMFGEQSAVSVDRDNLGVVDQQLRESTSCKVWEFAPVPPSRSEVVEWFENTFRDLKSQPTQARETRIEPHVKPNVLSQIEGPTQKDYSMEYPAKGQSTSVVHQNQYMSIMSLEVHVNSRGVLSPNPEEDEISCVFWCIQSEDEDLDANGNIPGVHVGMVYHEEGDVPETKIVRALRIETDQQTTELDLINRVVDIVRFYDPDIITGYEVHNNSWGYLIERARKKYDFDLCDELSRVKSQAHGRFGKDSDRWGFNHTSSIRVTGRHIINLWRAMRSELALLQYSMENVVFHVLQRRIPHYSFRDLTAWYQSGKPRNLMKLVSYYISRVQMNLEILESNELISRTSEQARLLGVDFFSVFSRGSQFKVESLMFRIAKPENFMLVSPSRKQVGQQNALECLPLVMEPQSDFYTSPLVVLDFQSLYPSVMIAYNYCYSTFLGRARQWRGRDKMGFIDYQRQPHLLELLKDKINIAPNGMVYTKPEVRTSLLARMLTEILETRVMVKTGMKLDKDDKILQRLLNNRQLALKLIANVTYGYTSASFSGRMPCSEIADSIVQTGRETLEKAIALIHSVESWGAEVVYGDTDSLFVYLKGRTREEAFDVGEEIAKTVTDMNPRPVKLKFEKVYHPCVLLAKKRYVGFKYEHRDQKEPEFDAKGIETVRRDGTPAEQKIEEKTLKILFRTADLSQVKSYFQKQCTKIMQGNVSIQDFCFAREVRLGTYSERGLPPPGALISTKKMLEDPRLEPQYGERVPYVVVTGAPGSRLIDRCVAPETLLNDAQLDLDAEYYITKNIIPPLERIFNLVGANVRQWYDEMPKFHRIRRIEGTTTSTSTTSTSSSSYLIPKTTMTNGKTLESYMKSSLCLVCKTNKISESINSSHRNLPLCNNCLQTPHISLLALTSRRQVAEKRVLDLHRICRSCMGVSFGDEVNCDSKDCPIFYSRTRHMANWRHARVVMDPVVKALEDWGDDNFTGSRNGNLDW